MGVRLPPEWRFESLSGEHDRKSFNSVEPAVTDWLRTKSRQHQDKHLSTTRVLLDDTGAIAGYYTLAHAQVHLSNLPHDIARKLPKRMLPVVILAWLGRDKRYRGRGLGDTLLAQALLDCHRAARLVDFVAVILDCLNDAAREFYLRYDFVEFPGRRDRLLLPRRLLDAMTGGT